MNEQAVFSADFEGDLPRRLDEWLGLDVADGPADFGDDHIGIGFFSDVIDEVLDLVGDMRDDLDGAAKVFSPPFLIQNVPIDFAGR